MWQKLVHAFTRGIDSTLRCLRTILSRTLAFTTISMNVQKKNYDFFEKKNKREINPFRP